MKNLIKKTALMIGIIFGISAFTLPVFAATSISLNPETINIIEGQRFTINISVNTQGIMDYAEKVEIKFPKDILTVDSFIFSPTWIAMTQAGYDSIDNVNGSMVKTAGYPAGITTATAFGTISFYAKNAGSGVITVGDNSLAFQASTQSAMTGGSTNVTVNAKAIVPISTKPIIKPVENTKEKTAIASSTTIKLSQDAAVAGSVDAIKTITIRYKTAIAVLSIIILALISYIIYISKKKSQI